jgi:D-arabinose 1-dehydrogenase-like Zn-dependent alcohol dehydrogenase
LLPYDGVTKRLLTAACYSITAYNALKKVADFQSDESRLIVGAGGVGLAVIGMAKAVIKAKIIGAEVDSVK